MSYDLVKTALPLPLIVNTDTALNIYSLPLPSFPLPLFEY